MRGSYVYLYLFVDLFSRKIVGWQVYDCESAELASGLLQDICARQGWRAAVYERARQNHPQRWSKQCRNWRRVDQVHLNPDTPQNKEFETLKKAA